MSLSIIMPGLTARHESYPEIMRQLHEQADGKPVEVLALIDNRFRTLGVKLNALYRMAKGDFVVPVADDDLVSDDFVDSLLRQIDATPDVDVITFNISVSGDVARLNKSLAQKGGTFERLWGLGNNCLCPNVIAVRREHTTDFEFPDDHHSGEDRLFLQHLLKKRLRDAHIPRVLYRVRFRCVKPEFLNRTYAPRPNKMPTRVPA